MARPSRRDRLDTYQHELRRAKTWRQDNKKDKTWRRMADLYQGKFMPESTSEHRMRVNLAFSTVNTILPNVALNYPKISVKARRAEDEDRSVINQQILNYWWKKWDFHDQFMMSVEDSIIFGFGWVKVGWLYEEEEVPISDEEREVMLNEALREQDNELVRAPELQGNMPTPEDILATLPTTTSVAVEDRPFVQRVSPFDIYVSPEATSMSDIRWIAQRILVRKDELEKDPRYSPKHRQEAASGMDETTETMDDPRYLDEYRYKEDEWVVIWEYYDIERSEMSVFADSGEGFLMDPIEIPLVYGHPFEMIRNYDVPEEFYPKGDLEEIEDMILEISLTRSQMMQWREKYATKYLLRAGAIDSGDIDKLTNRRDGQIINVNDDGVDLNDVVAPLPINSLDPRLFDWSAQIQSDINEVSGVSEIQRGNAAGTDTATEASLLADAANARSKHKLHKVEAFISRIARKLHMVGAQFLTGEQFVRVVGEDNAPMFVPYNRDTVMGEYDFEVEAGSTQPQNDTYRRQQGIALMQSMIPFLEMGVIDPLKLAEHVMRESFGIRNASTFLTPQAYQMLQQQKMMEQQAAAGPDPMGGVAGPGGQPGALGAPGNGVGLDAPQPMPADRADMNQAAAERPRSS